MSTKEIRLVSQITEEEDSTVSSKTEISRKEVVSSKVCLGDIKNKPEFAVLLSVQKSSIIASSINSSTSFPPGGQFGQGQFQSFGGAQQFQQNWANYGQQQYQVKMRSALERCAIVNGKLCAGVIGYPVLGNWNNDIKPCQALVDFVIGSALLHHCTLLWGD